MTDRQDRWNIPRVLLGILVVTVLLTLILSGFTSGVSFGPYNLGWDGTSDFRDIAESNDLNVTIVRDATSFEDVRGDGNVAVILAPDSPYSVRESTHLREFVESGGRLVIAGEIDSRSIGLLEDIGVASRFDGRMLRDERNHFKGPALPVANPITEHRLSRNIESITLNHGTALDPGNSTVLFATSEYAYLDTDGDGVLDDTEQVDSYPVVTIQSIGEGEVIAVADSSMFINTMLERDGNRLFAGGLLSERDSMYLDISHSIVIPPLVKILLIVRSSPLTQGVLAALFVGAVGVWSFSPRINVLDIIGDKPLIEGGHDVRESKRIEPREALVSHLEERYPELGDERIRKIVKEVKPRDGQEEVDD